MNSSGKPSSCVTHCRAHSLSNERDVVPVECEQSMIGDGNAMGITPEVTQHLFRPAERRLDVDHPLMGVTSEEDGEIALCRQVLDRASKPQTFLSKGILQSFNKLATEHLFEHFQ